MADARLMEKNNHVEPPRRAIGRMNRHELRPRNRKIRPVSRVWNRNENTAM